MTEDKASKMEKLRTLALSSAQSPKPKRALLGWKCPKCSGKLNKESIKEMVFTGEGGSEVAGRIVHDLGLPDGVYQMSINHFVCKCGYEFVKIQAEPPNANEA